MSFESEEIFPNAELCLINQFMLEQYDIAPERWLIGTGLDKRALHDTELHISLFHFDIIYRNIFRIANDPAVGLKLGRAMNLSRWGLLLNAFITADCVGDALATANKFKSLVRSRFLLSPSMHGDEVYIRIDPHAGTRFPVNSEFSYELLLGTLRTQIQDLSAKPFAFSRVELAYAKPMHHTDYETHLACPVRFGASESHIVMPVHIMKDPLPLANKAVSMQARKACQREIEKLEQVRSGDIKWQIISVLNRSPQVMALDQVAEALSLNARTLRRKLQSANTSFSQLLLQFKQQKATHLLLDKQLSVKQVAAQCGYQTPAAFRSAFKAWYGISPSDYKKSF